MSATSTLKKAAGLPSTAASQVYKLTIANLGAYATGGIPIKAIIEQTVGIERAVNIVAIIGRAGGKQLGEYDADLDLLKIYDASNVEIGNSVATNDSFDVTVWSQ